MSQLPSPQALPGPHEHRTLRSSGVSATRLGNGFNSGGTSLLPGNLSGARQTPISSPTALLYLEFSPLRCTIEGHGQLGNVGQVPAVSHELLTGEIVAITLKAVTSDTSMLSIPAYASIVNSTAVALSAPAPSTPQFRL